MIDRYTQDTATEPPRYAVHLFQGERLVWASGAYALSPAHAESIAAKLAGRAGISHDRATVLPVS